MSTSTEPSPDEELEGLGIGPHLHAHTKDLEALDGISQHPCDKQDDISHHQDCHQPQQLQVFDNLQKESRSKCLLDCWLYLTRLLERALCSEL